MKKLILHIQLVRNMGLRYTLFRLQYELKKRFLKTEFIERSISAEGFKLDYSNWLKQRTAKLLLKRGTNSIIKKRSLFIQSHFEKIAEGSTCFFSHEWKALDRKDPWHINPDSLYKYDATRHWSKIADYSLAQGDIKYVWERARFTHLLDIIRHDNHYEQDHAKMVMDEIMDWIKANPPERGPHYRCSQEISLRLMHWLMALDYYEGNAAITPNFWEQFEASVYAQLQHVYRQINFSRIAVRNNHALTESLLLYIGGCMFTHFPEANKWRTAGKRFFEEEVAYQIYEDGSYLQFSNNYHRVVVQLLTVALTFAEQMNDRWSEVVYQRAKLSLQFLVQQCEPSTGELPNYGSNDGALFFPLSDATYRDYRPALNALHVALYGTSIFNGVAQEEAAWLCNAIQQESEAATNYLQYGLQTFQTSHGGYFLHRDDVSFTFMKCVSYKDRPAQADNLHVDLWYKGKNILRDNGSFKYNADLDDVRYFMGTASHNTVQLGDADQMLKGGRFIWYYWNKKAVLHSNENEEAFCMEASVEVYGHLKKGIRHKRSIKKSRKSPEWIITDYFNERANLAMHQRWHIAEDFLLNFEISAEDEHGKNIALRMEDVYYSSHYGEKERSKCIIFTSESNCIKTRIALK